MARRRGSGKSPLAGALELIEAVKGISLWKALLMAAVLVGSLWTFTGARDTVNTTAERSRANFESIQDLETDVKGLNTEVDIVRENVGSLYDDIKFFVAQGIERGSSEAVRRLNKALRRVNRVLERVENR